ncbi:carbohydrate-binding domain-containing protein [Paenibacillus sp. FSL W8-0194]|uniref:carbohydrate-binding domain-containing protein n=1 Tax=Paenibacillus sp. FSL W8-0194 TaxID=2921711 RepID=UPI0030D6E9D4
MKPSYKTKFAAILILSAMLASGCTTSAAGTKAATDGTSTDTAAAEAAVDASKANAQLASLKIKDLVQYDGDDTTVDWEESKATKVTLNGASAAVDGAGAKASGGKITISSAGTYVVSGKLTGGSIAVDAGEDDVVRLVLNGAHIASPDGPAIQVKKAGKTVVTLAKGTENTLSDGTKYADSSEDAPTAALFSQDDLTINGTGQLTVQGNYKDGITSKDDLKIVGGTLSVNAADDGIIGRDLAAVKGGSIYVNAGGDGFKTTYDGDKNKGYLLIEDGTFRIEAGSDGFQAAASLLIDGGTYDVVTGGGSANAEPHEEEMPMGRPDFGGRTEPEAQGEKAEAQGKDSGDAAAGATNSGKPSASSSGSASQANENAANKDGSASAGTEAAQTADEESESASMKGLKAEAGIAVSGGTFNIDSADDTVHSNGSILISGGDLDLATGDDGIHADVSIVVSGGKVNIKESYEGIEAADITLSGGEVRVVASDDGVNASDGSGSSEGPGRMFGGQRPEGMPGQPPAGDSAQSGDQAPAGTSSQSGSQNTDSAAGTPPQPPAGQDMPGGPGGSAGTAKLTISGAYLTVDAGGDGLDANGSITMTGGTVLVNGPASNGNGALDYDGTFEQSGGLLVAAGSAGMAQAPSESSSQRSVLMTFPGTVKAGTLVTLTDGKGTPMLSFAPAKDIQSIVISTPDLKSGDTYAFYTGGQSSATAKDGLYAQGKLTGGTKIVSFKLGEAVTYVNESGVTTGGGGFGGGRGQGRPGGFRGQGNSAGNGAPAPSDSGSTQDEKPDSSSI